MKQAWVCFEIDLSLFLDWFQFVWDWFDRLFYLLVVCEHTQQIDLKRKKQLLQSTLLSGTTSMKHMEMFSTREYTTKKQFSQNKNVYNEKNTTYL